MIELRLLRSLCVCVFGVLCVHCAVSWGIAWCMCAQSWRLRSPIAIAWVEAEANAERAAALEAELAAQGASKETLQDLRHNSATVWLVLSWPGACLSKDGVCSYRGETDASTFVVSCLSGSLIGISRGSSSAGLQSANAVSLMWLSWKLLGAFFCTEAADLLDTKVIHLCLAQGIGPWLAVHDVLVAWFQCLSLSSVMCLKRSVCVCVWMPLDVHRLWNLSLGMIRWRPRSVDKKCHTFWDGLALRWQWASLCRRAGVCMCLSTSHALRFSFQAFGLGIVSTDSLAICQWFSRCMSAQRQSKGICLWPHN